MYYVCIDYNGLFDDFGTEVGNFDPFYFIDCSVDEVWYELNYNLLDSRHCWCRFGESCGAQL